VKQSLKQLFEKALKHGGSTHTLEDIEKGIQNGSLQYWGDNQCAVITEIINYPRTTKLHIFIVAGNYAMAVERYLPELKRFANEIGASAITAIGRKGFERIVPKIGFQPKYTAFQLDLERNDHE